MASPLVKKLERSASGTQPRHLVFLCHAGEQKRMFASYLEQFLQLRGIPVFNDEHSLQLGGKAEGAMLAAVRSAPVGTW